MSTLKVDNLLNSAGNESPISVPGAAKAWVTFDGTTGTTGNADVTIASQFNVASVTDNGTGDKTITFSNAMPNANYVVLGSIANTSNQYASHVAGPSRGAGGVQVKGTVAPTTTTVTIETLFNASSAANGATHDFSDVFVVVFAVS